MFAGCWLPVSDSLPFHFSRSSAYLPSFSRTSLLTHVSHDDPPQESSIRPIGHVLEGLVQLPAEEVADGRELADGLRGADLPLAVEVVLGRLGADVGHGDQADLREVGGQPLQVGVVGVVDVPLHVRLARADPDLADEHVVDLDLVLALDRQRVRPPGGHRVELHRPFLVVAGLGGLGLAVDGDGDLLARVGPAPDLVLLVSLEHHVRREQSRDLDVGRGRRGERRRGQPEGQRADRPLRGDAHGEIAPMS